MAEEAGPHQVTTHWTALGGALRTGAAAAAWGTAGETEVFALHEDGQVWDRYWDGKSIRLAPHVRDPHARGAGVLSFRSEQLRLAHRDRAWKPDARSRGHRHIHKNVPRE